MNAAVRDANGRPGGRWRANLALLLGALILALLLCEVALRVTGFGRPSPLIPHGDLPFKRRPFDEFVNRKEIVRSVRLNNWGFHDRDRTRDGDRFRVLALGDSFVEGLQVEPDELFTSQIGGRLADRGLDVEVMNGGMGGIGTAYQYLLWQEFFRHQIDVDHVVLFVFNGNDLPNNHPVLERQVNGNEVGGKVYVDTAGEVYVRQHERSLRQRVLAWTDRHSALSHTVHEALYRLKTARARRQSRRAGESPSSRPTLDAEWRETISGTLSLIESWNEELASEGVGFSVVVLPPPEQTVENPYGHPQKARFVRQLKQLGRQSNLEILEVSFEGLDLEQIYTYDGTSFGHFQPRGHRVVGEIVADWLGEVIDEDAP